MDSMDMSLSKLQEMVKGREAWYATVHGEGQGSLVCYSSCATVIKSWT